MFRLDSKTALITGATGGIGQEIAKTLHALGATILATGTKIDRLEALKGSLKDRIHIYPCALNDEKAMEGLISYAEKEMGGIDILINNAGMTKDNLLLRLKDQDFQDVFDINFMSAVRLSRAFLKGMMKKRWGRILNISSIVGVMGNGGQTNYAATKAAMIAFSKSLAQEVASRNITVNCIAPGFIKTHMTEVLGDDIKQKLEANIPLGYVGDPSDIASSVAFLASNEARYITGHTLHVNGGMLMV
jgi:3-oxoacyl-[acyl-carrier protein] reductase